MAVSPLQQMFQSLLFILVSFNELFIPCTQVDVYTVRRTKNPQLSFVIVKASVLIERKAPDLNWLTIEREFSTKGFDWCDSEGFLCFRGIGSSSF